MAENILEIRDLVVRFSGLVAVDHVSFSLQKGGIYGLIGTNGAGKSTVINMISGNLQPTSGQILFQGKEIGGNKAHQNARLGIARTFQNLRIFPNDTVIENVITARQQKRHYNLLQLLLNTPGYRKAEKKIREESAVCLDQFQIREFADQKASSLSYGQQRRVEIARCLALDPKLLLLDEPAAGMNPSESRQLVEDIQSMHRSNPDMTILLIEHDMKVVMSLCEYIFVMAQGKLIAEGTPDEIQHSDKVIAAYMGGGQHA